MEPKLIGESNFIKICSYGRINAAIGHKGKLYTWGDKYWFW